MGTIYLLHFRHPYPGGSRPQHYLGFSHNLAARIRAHRTGRSSVLCREMARRDIPFRVAATWPGDRSQERQWHRNGHLKRRCPICQSPALILH